MSKMQNAKLPTHLFLYFAFCILLLLLLTGCTQSALDAAQEAGALMSPEVAGSVRVGQTFTPDTDGLDVIGVALAHNNRPLNAALVFHLQQTAGDSSDLATLTLPVGGVNRNGFTLFHFARQEHSAGQPYYFYLEAPEAPVGDAVQAFMSDSDVYKSGQAYINGQPVASDLAFRVYTTHEFTLSGVLGELRERMAADRAFFAVYTFLLLLVVGLFLLTFVGSKGH